MRRRDVCYCLTAATASSWCLVGLNAHTHTHRLKMFPQWWNQPNSNSYSVSERMGWRYAKWTATQWTVQFVGLRIVRGKVQLIFKLREWMVCILLMVSFFGVFVCVCWTNACSNQIKCICDWFLYFAFGYKEVTRELFVKMASRYDPWPKILYYTSAFHFKFCAISRWTVLFCINPNGNSQGPKSTIFSLYVYVSLWNTIIVRCQ